MLPTLLIKWDNQLEHQRVETKVFSSKWADLKADLKVGDLQTLGPGMFRENDGSPVDGMGFFRYF